AKGEAFLMATFGIRGLVDDDIESIRHAVADWAAHSWGGGRAFAAGAIDEEADSLWKEIADLGIPSMLISEDRGGGGLPLAAMLVVLDEIGYAGFSEPIFDAACV